MLSDQQRAFFETFGYLRLRGAVSAEIGWIIPEFLSAWERRGITHAGAATTGYPGILISASPRLGALLEHAAVAESLDQLLGDGWSCYGGDGSFRAGDTAWHSDVHDGTLAAKGICRHLKVAFYLDRLTRDTGALRFIPGSQHGSDTYARLLQEGLCGGGNPLHLDGRDVPAVAIDNEPGDVVIFDHRLKHAAFGGGAARRNFVINVFAPCPTEREREAARVVMRAYRDQEKVDWLTGPGWCDWIDSLPASTQRRFATVRALGAEVMAEAAAAPV